MKHAKNEPRKKGWIAAVLLFAGTGICIRAASVHAGGFSSWYCRNIYSLISRGWTAVTGPIPVSVSEVIILLLPLLLAADIIICRHHLRAVPKHAAVLAAVLFFMYQANCGVNYYREPFVTPEVTDSAEFTAEELADFCVYASGMADNCIAECRHGDYPDWDETSRKASDSMDSLGEEHPELKGPYPLPKKLFALSGLFSSMGVSGIYSPFTIEANVNGMMPGMDLPFTACHELAHLKGFMNEGEANYIGWLACIGSEDPYFRRSGWINALAYSTSALYSSDPGMFDRISGSLSPEAMAEIAANHDFWRSHKTKASEVQDKMNDRYLRSNGQSDGIRSYGRFTSLMLLWYRDNK